jgi:hypothetical protein
MRTFELLLWMMSSLSVGSWLAGRATRRIHLAFAAMAVPAAVLQAVLEGVRFQMIQRPR